MTGNGFPGTQPAPESSAAQERSKISAEWEGFATPAHLRFRPASPRKDAEKPQAAGTSFPRDGRIISSGCLVQAAPCIFSPQGGGQVVERRPFPGNGRQILLRKWRGLWFCGSVVRLASPRGGVSGSRRRTEQPFAAGGFGRPDFSEEKSEEHIREPNFSFASALLRGTNGKRRTTPASDARLWQPGLRTAGLSCESRKSKSNLNWRFVCPCLPQG